ncbi:MAG: hypothetical protein AAFQ64_08995 [Pseudomonadota bacterium]
MTNQLPELALSVRQPWAWAIIFAGKVIENRSEGSIRAGKMDLRRIAIHAATGMRKAEYDWAVWRMDQDGVRVPRPADLSRGAIIGAVDVVDIVTESDSPWFGGPCGLVLKNPSACEPIPCKGALGYFRWAPASDLASTPKWMRDYSVVNADPLTPDLFADAGPAFETPPPKPFGTRKS